MRAFEPMIYTRFLRFTEYEKRKATEYPVIHHTGFFGIDRESMRRFISIIMGVLSWKNHFQFPSPAAIS